MQIEVKFETDPFCLTIGHLGDLLGRERYRLLLTEAVTIGDNEVTFI